MVRVPADVTAAQRARWLAELSEALDEAQMLLSQLAPAELWDVDALDLSARVEAARAHVRILRIDRRTAPLPELPPERTNLHPWERAIGGCSR